MYLLVHAPCMHTYTHKPVGFTRVIILNDPNQSFPIGSLLSLTKTTCWLVTTQIVGEFVRLLEVN